MNDTQSMIGKPIEEVKLWINEASRDAIHIAVEPIRASEELKPGEHVGIVPDHAAGRAGNHIGIVDPFLKDPVEEGEFFWLFLYPNTITGLRHHWDHPAFPTSNDEWNHRPDANEAEKWLRDFASLWGMNYDTMIEGAVWGGGITAEGMDIHSWSEIEPEDRIKFWRSLEEVTGKQFDHEHRENTYFSCSC